MEKVIFVGMYVITKYLQILVIYCNKDSKYFVETASSAWLSATHLQTLNQRSYQICWQAGSQKPRMRRVDHQPYNPHRHIAYFACAASPTTPVTSYTSRALPAPPHLLPIILRVRCQPCRPQIPRVIRVRCQHHCLPDPSSALPAPPRCCCRCGTIGMGRAAGYPTRHVTPWRQMRRSCLFSAGFTKQLVEFFYVFIICKV